MALWKKLFQYLKKKKKNASAKNRGSCIENEKENEGRSEREENEESVERPPPVVAYFQSARLVENGYTRAYDSDSDGY